jgi:hypothetical protein
MPESIIQVRVKRITYEAESINSYELVWRPEAETSFRSPPGHTSIFNCPTA